MIGGERMRRKLNIGAVAVLAAGLSLGAYSLIGYARAAVRTAFLLSPWLFPLLLAVCALPLSLALFLQAPAASGETQAPREGKTTLLLALAAAAYAALLPLLHFLPTTALFLAALIWLLGERRWQRIAAVSVAAPLLLYALFGLTLQLRLP